MSDDFSLDPPPETSTPVAHEHLLDGLNPEQCRAVKATEGPILVLSGAGTGKTRVLTTRLAYILACGKAQPWQVLAVTFTNRTARELRDRLAAMIGPTAESLWLGTFHALGVRILRRHAELVGLKSNFTILDTDDQLRLLKQLLQDAGIDPKRWPPKNLLGAIQRWKDRGLTPDKVTSDMAGEMSGAGILSLYAQYQARLLEINAADFGDLLLHCLNLFHNNPDVLEHFQKQFHYILVDEYQDTNVSQYLWLRLLAQHHRNLCCVGDDDQSIYSWRGAEVGNILRFDHDFPGAEVIRLERNYRSTPSILKAASGLIGHNRGRLAKTLRAAIEDNPGEKITIRGVWDGEEEARVITEEILAEQGRSSKPCEIAILVRAGFQTREFEDRFIITGVPYRVIGGPRFYERQEIRDALAYLRVITQPDDDLALARILNVPKRGLGDATLQTLNLAARGSNVSLMEAARRLVGTDELTLRARNPLRRLIDDFDRWREALTTTDHRELAAMVLNESGYIDMWRSDRSPDAPGRVENLKELISALVEFSSLMGFLEHVSLVMENDQRDGPNRVNVMTLHAAKGLEFDVVFLPGWEEGLFPHQRALDEGGEKALEEERRLAYVGITRARRKVTVSFVANRRIYNRWQNAIPSRFLDEIPAESVNRYSAPGIYSGSPGVGDHRRDWSKKKHYDEAPASSFLPVDSAATGYRVGERVFHQKFGYGVVREMNGDMFAILFDRVGVKKILASFLLPG